MKLLVARSKRGHFTLLCRLHGRASDHVELSAHRWLQTLLIFAVWVSLRTEIYGGRWKKELKAIVGLQEFHRNIMTLKDTSRGYNGKA